MTKYEDKIEQIKDILDNCDLDELVGYGPCLDGDDAVYPMDDFDDILCTFEPWSIVRAVYYGDFCPMDNYFRFNVYMNLESTDDPVGEGWVNIDAFAKYAVDYNDDFGVNEIRTLLDQWKEEEENNEEVAE